MTDEALSAASRAWIERADPSVRRARGQYPTPRALRDRLIALLARDGESPTRILDPSCGTGEFLAAAAERWPDAECHGWEIDPELAPIARGVAPGSTVTLGDALDREPEPTFDLVIGNPPYFETKRRARYAGVISGRANVYAMFVQLGLEALRPDGRLAYVVSTSMNNGAYFRALRSYVLAHASIERMEVVDQCDWFEGAQQAVMLIVLRRGGEDDGRFVFRRGDHAIFTPDPRALDALFEGRTTIAELGWTVRTGAVVWNQWRDALTDDPTDAVRLIWSREIVGERIDIEAEFDRPRYVRGVVPDVGPAVVVNRVTGRGARTRIRASVIPAGVPFVGENHVNVVLPPPGATEADALALAAALRDPVAVDAARRLTGNTQISKTELAELIPVCVARG